MTNLRSSLTVLLVLTPLALFSTARPAAARDAVVELDPASTQIEFTLGAVLHSVHGTFKLKRGTVRFDPATGHASGLVVVDATSGESGNSSRDHKMHKDVLESAAYPEITFAPDKVQGQVLPQGDFKVEVLGTFTLHGVSHPLTIVIQVHLAEGHLVGDARFTIPYKNWGVKNPSTLFLRVDDTVDISIRTAGQVNLYPAN